MILRDELKTVKIDGEKLTLPRVLCFSHYRIKPDYREYDVIGFRSPKKGEWYLSGALITPFVASNDLTMEFWVVLPTNHLKEKTITGFVKI